MHGNHLPKVLFCKRLIWPDEELRGQVVRNGD